MINYLISPQHVEIENADITVKVKFLINSCAYCFGFMILSIFFIASMDSFIVNCLDLPSISATLNKNNIELKESKGYYSYFLVLLIGPFWEEIVFRLPLILNVRSIGISLGVLVYRYIGENIYFNFYNSHDYLRLFFALNAFFLVVRYLNVSFLLNIRENYFKHFFYLTAILFALVHIQNFASSDYRLFIFYPIYVLPQFIMGLFIGNIRMKYGFLWGLLLHSLINLPSALLT